MQQQNKVCFILAGPNGGGKSTIHRALALDLPFVNADDIARRISPSAPESAAIEAGRLALSRLEELVVQGTSFIYETTLSSAQSIRLMRQCKALGYRVRLIFTALENADLHVRRVQERVGRGGHAIPEDVIRRRYDTSFQRLSEALEIADQITLMDNSDFHARVILAIEGGKVVQSNIQKERPLDAKFVEAAQLYSGK